MNGMDRRLRDLLEAAAGEPPHRVSAEAVRRRVSRRRARECLAGAAAVAVIAAGVPLGLGASGHAPGPAGRHRPPAGPTVYVDYGIAHGTSRDTPVVIPDQHAPPARAGNPIKVGDGAIAIDGGQIANTPDGKTAYVAGEDPPPGPARSAPVARPPTRAGKPIQSAGGSARLRSRTPRTGRPPASPPGSATTVTPISTATSTPGKAIQIGRRPVQRSRSTGREDA